LATSCGGAGKPVFPHLRASDEPPAPMKITGVVTPPAQIALENIAADYLAPARDDMDLRGGGEDPNVPLLVDEYTDAAGMPVVHIQHLSYANLGLWLLDNTFDDDGDSTILNNADDGLHYEYRLLMDNRVSSVPSSGSATYQLEGDIVYKGERFYPDTATSGEYSLTADFAARTISGALGIEEATATLDNIGSTLSSGLAIPAFTNMNLAFNAAIGSDGTFSGEMRVEQGDGFFFDFNRFDTGELNGAFFDAADYDPSTAAPAEIGATFSVTDTMGETLRGGFIGARE
jgi:hypothetical protein